MTGRIPLPWWSNAVDLCRDQVRPCRWEIVVSIRRVDSWRPPWCWRLSVEFTIGIVPRFKPDGGYQVAKS